MEQQQKYFSFYLKSTDFFKLTLLLLPGINGDLVVVEVVDIPEPPPDDGNSTDVVGGLAVDGLLVVVVVGEGPEYFIYFDLL
jgi:hypothetical protein